MNVKEETVLALLDGVRSGARTAFFDLCECYRPLILSQVGLFSEPGGMWDEMMGDAILALYRAALRYRPGSGVTFGLYARICIRNALISAYRKAAAHAHLSLEELSSRLTDEGVEAPDAHLIDKEEVGDLYRAALSCLSGYELRVFHSYIGGETPSEIARTLGRSEKSVANAIGRMLRKLRAELT